MCYGCICTKCSVCRYTKDASKNTWQRRKRGRQVEVGVVEAAIGRIYTISPKQGDCFYLRLLLLSIRGPTSFQMLRTVNGTTHESYRDACLALGLLEDDNIHRQTLQEDFFRILYTLLIPFGKFVFVTQRNCVATEQRH